MFSFFLSWDIDIRIDSFRRQNGKRNRSGDHCSTDKVKHLVEAVVIDNPSEERSGQDRSKVDRCECESCSGSTKLFWK